MPKCHDCGKFCRPVEWQMIYSGALPEPQEEIYKCASCVEKNGSFVPQSGIKPEHSCGVAEMICRNCGVDKESTLARIKVLLKERDALQAEIAELVAALKPFGAIDLVESRLPAEFAMLILRARAAIAKVRKP